MIDKKIEAILNKFEVAHFEVAVVGGAVRDILQKKDVSDWDLATSAKPEEILKLFANKSFYNNRFGTVGIKADGEVVEVTTYRKEQRYKDWRHPDVVVWGKSLDEDLARRDFTINAIALRYAQGKPLQLVDPFDGQKDLKNKIIKTVGDP